jgi:PiT family inorganic phosphate transporter
MMTSLLIFVIALALIFDFINGFHDAANSIATIVSTRVLTPFQAVLWAAAFNFLVFFVVKDHKIANTIAKTVNEQFVTMNVILSGLLAAIAWNLTTWRFGIPSSSSHALIGGFAGAGMAKAFLSGANIISAVNMHYVVLILTYIVLAPFIGLAIAYVITIIFTR